MIEHLSLSEGIEVLRKIHELLEPDGKLLMTTPNIYFPAQFWRSATHKTPHAYDELAGLLLYLGFEVAQVYRLHNDPIHRLIAKRYLLLPLFKLLSIDFAPGIMVVAKK